MTIAIITGSFILIAIAVIVCLKIRSKRKTYYTPTSILPLIGDYLLDDTFTHYRSGGYYIIKTTNELRDKHCPIKESKP